MKEKAAALIVGVTGMAGISIAEALKSPTAPGGPWIVYGAARRPKPTWFPLNIVDHYVSFDASDVTDTRAHLSPISCHVTHVFWVAIQVSATTEDENIVANSAMLSNVLDVLTTHDKTIHITLQTGTSHYMGPVHYKDQFIGIKSNEPPFHEYMDRLPYPNFYYKLEDIVKSYGPKLTYSIHRPSIIVGASTRSVYNGLLALAVYAHVCKYLNAPFKYPGNRYTWQHFCDMTDTRVLAEQHVWGAVSDKAQNEAFNCTNGDVFTWKRMWGVLCEEFGVEFVPLDGDGDGDECGFDLTVEMRDRSEVWDKIVEEKGLVKTKIEEMMTSFAAVQNVLNFNFQLVSSMNKSKEFGFFGYVDTLKSVGFWLAKLREMKIIP